jgi:hypothetical protein
MIRNKKQKILIKIKFKQTRKIFNISVLGFLSENFRKIRGQIFRILTLLIIYNFQKYNVKIY